MSRARSLAARLTYVAATPERRERLKGFARVKEISRQLVEACHPKQRDFVRDPSKEIAAVVGARGGKTTGGRARFLRCMTKIPRARCLYITLTRSQAERFMWAPLKKLNNDLQIGATFSESKLLMTLPNGSTLRLVGADDKREIEKLRGEPFHEVQIDEAASHSAIILSYLIERIIGPRLGDYDGVIVMYGTPSHLLTGYFYEATRPQSEEGTPFSERDEEEETRGWSTHHWNAKDGADAGVPAMISAWKRFLIDKKKRGWSDDHPVHRREHLGLWASDDTESVFRYRPHVEGEPWNQWDPERDEANLGIAKLPPGEWLYTYGMDMGHTDPFVLEVFAHRALSNELLHVYEYVAEGKGGPNAIAKLLVGDAWVKRVLNGLEPREPGGIIGVTGWPYGMVADLAALGGAILQELKEVYGVPIEAAEKKDKIDAIEMANGDLLSGRIKILKGSILETQMLHLQWSIDPWGKLKEDKGARNDATDAFIYLRRKAMHLIGETEADAKPKAGSPEAAEAWLEENVAQLTRPKQSDDYPADDLYEDDWA